jgi:hypothetical protein
MSHGMNKDNTDFRGLLIIIVPKLYLGTQLVILLDMPPATAN